MRTFFAVLLLCPIMVSAQTVYVTDNLRLGLHRAEKVSFQAPPAA